MTQEKPDTVAQALDDIVNAQELFERSLSADFIRLNGPLAEVGRGVADLMAQFYQQAGRIGMGDENARSDRAGSKRKLREIVP